MAKFRGTTNLHLGHPVWAASAYDHETREYVVEVDGDDAKRFRGVAADYGFVEEGAPVAEKPVKRVRKVAEPA